MRTLLALALLATPLAAQDLDPRYDLIGTFNGSVDGAAVTLSSVFDREKARAMVRRRGKGNLMTISVSARTIAEDGTPTSPGVSFTIGPLGVGGDGVRSDIFFNNSSGYYVADVDNANRATLKGFVQDDTSVTFSVEADLKPIVRGDEGFVPDASRESVALTGTYTGNLPATE